MLSLYRFTGMGQRCYIWICGKKEFKLVKFRSDFVLSNDYLLVTPNINNYFNEVENSYIINTEHVPTMKSVIDGEFDRLLLNNLGIIQKMIDSVETININTARGEVKFSLLSRNSFMNITKGKMLNDSLNYQNISNEEKKSLELSVKISRLVTIESMKEKYDCSWIFNEDGSMKKDYKCITDLDSLNWVNSELEKLDDDYYAGFDVETSGVKIFYMPDNKEEKSRLLGFSLSWKDDQGVYIPLESKVFECLDKKTVFDVLYRQLVRLKLIAHNGQFEWKAMYDNGYTVEIAEDTQLLNFNIFPIIIKGFLKLKNLTRVWFRHETWEFEQLFGGKADPEMLVYVPKDVLTIYGCADSDYARMLYFKLKEYLNESQLFPYRLDCKIIELLGKGEYYGAMKDVERIDETEKILVSNMEKIETEIFKYILNIGFDNKKEQIVVDLFDKIENWKNSEFYAKSQYSEMTDLEIINKLIPSDDNIKSEFIKEMDSLLNEKALNSDPKMQKILFDILNYPVLSYKRKTKKQKQKERERIEEAKSRGEFIKPKPPSPATDEAAMVNLLQYELEEPNNYFKDIVSDNGEVIISGEALNSYKYPFAKLFLEYKDINKQLTTFYKQHRENPSKYWYNENKQCQAVTGRLISTAQLLDKRTKKLIIPYENCYGVNADYSQIEIRNMAGNANEYWQSMEKLINKDELSVYHRDGIKNYIQVLNNPETDIHRETAANMLRKLAEDVTDDERSDNKTFSFGVPYGMLGFALSTDDITTYVDRLSENPDEQLEKIVGDNGIGVSKWNFANYPIYRYLEYNRKNILIERTDCDWDRIPPYFEGHKVGYVEDHYGRRRYFYLDELNENIKHSIFKEGGNFPVQAGSRELFFINKFNLYNDMKREGLVHNPTDGTSPEPDEFFMSVFVHDEFFGSVNINIHPFKILKLIYRNCFVNLKFHPTYFMGINFVNNWYEGKKGKYELPVMLVKSLYDLKEEEYPEYNEGYFIVRDDNGNKVNKLWVVDYFAQLVKSYEVSRILKEVTGLCGIDVNDIKEDFDWDGLSKNITSYVVRPLIVKYGIYFGASKTANMGTMLKIIWENRYHDFLIDNVVCTRRISGQDNDSDEDFDLFEELFDDSDSDVITAVNLGRLVNKTKELSFEKFQSDTIREDGFNNSFSVKPRREYESRNVYKDKIDSRVIIPISGKLILNFSNVKFENQRLIIDEIKTNFEDSNGSIVEVMNALGIRRQDFRIFNFTRKDIEEIMAKYEPLAESKGEEYV